VDLAGFTKGARNAIAAGHLHVRLRITVRQLHNGLPIGPKANKKAPAEDAARMIGSSRNLLRGAAVNNGTEAHHQQKHDQGLEAHALHLFR